MERVFKTLGSTKAPSHVEMKHEIWSQSACVVVVDETTDRIHRGRKMSLISSNVLISVCRRYSKGKQQILTAILNIQRLIKKRKGFNSLYNILCLFLGFRSSERNYQHESSPWRNKHHIARYLLPAFGFSDTSLYHTKCLSIFSKQQNQAEQLLNQRGLPLQWS